MHCSRPQYPMTRRDMLAASAGVALGAGAAWAAKKSQTKAAVLPDLPAYAPKGNINHAACKWCYRRVPMEQFCALGKKIGLRGVDLVGSDKDWAILKKYGMVSTMTPCATGIAKGLNDKANHERCLDALRKAVERTAEAGFTNVICMSGNRRPGLTDEEGLDNCAIALKQVVGLAEKKKVLLCMELLNSKVNHKGYMADKSAWGIKLCKKVGSENFKLLYDIYHMGVEGEDVIEVIRRDHQYFGHYHTGGVPGRHEIDSTQTQDYPKIMATIVKTGFKGWVAQEFIPKRDPMTSLAQAIKICDV